MTHTRAFIERDSRGRERLVLAGGSRRHSTSTYDRGTPRAHFADEREERSGSRGFDSEVRRLQQRVAYDQQTSYSLSKDNEKLRTLLNEERKYTIRLEDKLRETKRGGHERGGRDAGGDYKRAYEEKYREVQQLRYRVSEQEQLIRLSEARIAEKNRLLMDKTRTISYFKKYLRDRGYRVED